MKIFRKTHSTYWAAVASIAIAGCAAGPDFKKPAAPSVSGYTTSQPATMPSTTNVANGGETQQFVPGRDISGQWWELFHSKPLNDLIERSLRANPNLKSAQAALVVAREIVLSQKGAYYPSATASLSAARQQTSKSIAPFPNSNSFTFNLFTPQLSVSYVPDVFGLNRRTVESLQAQSEQARYALAATNITLSSNVVAAALQEASLREQIAATRELIKINTDELQILRDQFGKGYVGRLDVAAQESQLAQVQATLPPLLQQLDVQRHLLAALAGEFPSQGPAEEFKLATLQLPQELPLTVPACLVEQRPDVLQAEENAHAASAQIGIAVANRLPNIPLSADVGTMALSAGQMFANGNVFWTLAGSAAEPIFDGGILLHKERAAKAAFIEAEEQYRSTVQAAFQNVADTLTALEHDADAVKTAAAAKDAAAVTLDLTEQQVKSGYADYLQLLSAEQGYQQAVITLIQARANRYADTAALFQALGGGWWNRIDVPKY